MSKGVGLPLALSGPYKDLCTVLIYDGRGIGLRVVKRTSRVERVLRLRVRVEDEGVGPRTIDPYRRFTNGKRLRTRDSYHYQSGVGERFTVYLVVVFGELAKQVFTIVGSSRTVTALCIGRNGRLITIIEVGAVGKGHAIRDLTGHDHPAIGTFR